MTTTDRFVCGLAGAAPADLRVRLADPFDIGTCADMLAASPLTHVESLQAPLLLWHGLQDTMVPLKTTEPFVEQALALDKPLVWMTFPDGSHGLARDDVDALWLLEARFLQGCFGGRAEDFDAWPDDADVRIEGHRELLPGLPDNVGR